MVVKLIDDEEDLMPSLEGRQMVSCRDVLEVCVKSVCHDTSGPLCYLSVRWGMLIAGRGWGAGLNRIEVVQMR